MNKFPLSERDKREIEKMEAIIKLFRWCMSVIEVKHILLKINTHLDSITAMNNDLYISNIKPIVEIFQ
jgi:hypothetical protein